MLAMLCIDSDTTRLDQLTTDLSAFNQKILLLQATSLEIAEKLLKQKKHSIAIIIAAPILNDGDATALFRHKRVSLMRKIIYADNPSITLLTEYINQGKVDYFLPYPYQAPQLITLIQQQINEYYQVQKEQRQLRKTTDDSVTAIIQAPIVDFISQQKFLDYSLYSDKELSNLVINSLHKTLEDKQLTVVKLNYSADHILTREGERNHFLWFITKGSVLLKKRNAHGITQNITSMEAGSIVGGMSFLTAENAFSTGITQTKTEVVKVDNRIFSQIMHSDSSLLAPFTNLLLRNFNRRLQHSISTELALQETLQSLDIVYQQLLESEKMAVLGQLVAGVAHELNNPVAAILRGSEMLISLIPHLLSDDQKSPFSILAQKTLKKGLTITPLSTSEIRQRSRALQDKMSDKNLAKKLINMELDQQPIPLEKNRDLTESIHLLDMFYQAGTILRNSNACANRIDDLVKSLKHYAGHDSKEVSIVNVHEGLEETLIIFENRLKHYDVVKNYQKLPDIECHPIELGQVWTNLIANALDATGETGKLTLTTLYLPYLESPCIQLIFEDNGPGMSDEIKSKVFELNYTTKRKGNFGLGIGLTICLQIIKRHNGSIEIEDGSQGGSKFIVTLPVFNPIIEQQETTG